MSALVKITNGICNGTRIDGVYEFLSYEKTAAGMVVKTLLDGVPANVTIRPNVGSVEQFKIGSTAAPIEINNSMSEEEVEAIIAERFDVMLDLVRTLRTSEVKSLIITGATGIGKTWNVEEQLEEAELLEGQYWNTIGGKCTPFGLYEALYENRFEGSILVLDDVDVFSDDDMLNIFKKALDSTKRRVIDWRSASRLLDERGLPNFFEFKGKIIFLTNTNIYAEIARNTRRAVHLEAVIGRGVTLDLAIHDIRTVLIYIRMLIRKNNYLVKKGLTAEQQEMVINWLNLHRDSLAMLTLRTPLTIAEYMKTNMETWERNAFHTLLIPQQIRFTA